MDHLLKSQSGKLASTQDAETRDGEIGIGDAIRIVRRHWLIVLVTPMLCLALATVYLRLAVYSYTVVLTVTQVQAPHSSTLQGSLGGLASAAGIDVGAGKDMLSFNLYLAGLTSKLASDALAKDPKLMHALFSSEWSDKDQIWRAQSNSLQHIKDFVKRLLGIPVYKWTPPDAYTLHDFLEKNVKVDKDRQTQIVTVTLVYPNPKLAQELLARLDKTVDGTLRDRALERATTAIAYLNNQLQTSTIQEYREALVQSLVDQEHIKMMASSDLPFVAEPFGGPTASPLPTSPKPAATLVMALLIGGFLGALLALARDRFRHPNPK